MQLHQENTQRQTQVQKLAPHLIQANTLLQCSTMELQQVIEQEQQENPALESLEEGPARAREAAVCVRAGASGPARNARSAANPIRLLRGIAMIAMTMPASPWQKAWRSWPRAARKPPKMNG